MIETFQKYGGAGLILAWFLAAWVFLLFREKEKPRRILFVYVPAVVLVLFFNPLFYKLFSGLTEEAIYFRLIWLIPVTAVIGYGAVTLCGMLKGWRQVCFGIVAVYLAVISGKLVYTSPLFERAQNQYHVPQEVVEICDAIELEGREVMAAFPDEFLLYVRQYSARVCMPYGRESIMGTYNEFHELMKQGEILVEELAEQAKQYRCHYVILSENKKLLGDMEEYDYEVFGQVGEYIIYRDNTMDFRTSF